MDIWLLKTSEPMPVVNENQRLLRMGMIANELSRRGHKITWFSGTFEHSQKKQLFDRDTLVKVKENYDIYLMHGPKYKKNISISRIINYKLIALKFRKAAKKRKKPDLIYVSFPTIDYAEEAVKYGKKNDVPVIVDIRDLWPDIFNHNLSGMKKLIAQPYIKWIKHKTKKIMKNAFALNSISDAMLEWGLQKAGRSRNPYDQYFYLGYDKKDNSKQVDEITIDKNKFNLVFFATINNQYNYEAIVNLAKKLQEKDEDIILNIGGDGPQFPELKKKAEGIKNLHLFGWIDKDAMIYLLENAKLGLAPYKNTFDFQMSVSNKFAEYLSYGLPIVMTVDGYMKSLLEKNECGISSQNVDELCQFIVELKNNPEKYQKMSQNAQKLYEENFVAEKIYQNLVDYLENIGG